jgi:hypothetical protein
MKNILILALLLLLGFKDASAQYQSLDFIPDSNTRIIYIPVNFNIFRNSTGTNNFPDNETVRNNFRQVVVWMNNFYKNNAIPSDSVPGYILLPESKVQFVFNDVYYYNDTIGWGTLSTSNSPNDLYNRIISYDPNRSNQINILFNLFPSTVSQGINCNYTAGDYSEHYSIICYDKYGNGAPGYYTIAQNLFHEFGHFFGLYHTYHQGHEICDRTDPEFLDDVFLPYYDMSLCPISNTDTIINCEICWDDYVGDPYDTNVRASNNIMGGLFLNSYYMSRKQIGRMHRALHLNIIANNAYVLNPTTIYQNTSISYLKNYKLYDNLTITNNSTVTLSSRLLLPKKGVLTIDSGSTLIIKGVLFVDNYTIVVKSGGKLLIKNVGSIGTLKIANGGQVHVLCNGQICFESGARFMPMNVGDNLYLHSGYIIPNGYITNIQPFSSLMLGKVVYSSPNVLISGTQTNTNNIYSGNIVNTSATVLTTVPNGVKTYVWGESVVNIYKNFKVESGGYFEVNTINNSCQ